MSGGRRRLRGKLYISEFPLCQIHPLRIAVDSRPCQRRKMEKGIPCGEIDTRTVGYRSQRALPRHGLYRKLNQVIIAWMRQSEPAVLPIIAGSRPAQLQENIGALDVDLSAEQMAALNTSGNPDVEESWLR